MSAKVIFSLKIHLRRKNNLPDNTELIVISISNKSLNCCYFKS